MNITKVVKFGLVGICIAFMWSQVIDKQISPRVYFYSKICLILKYLTHIMSVKQLFRITFFEIVDYYAVAMISFQEARGNM